MKRKIYSELLAWKNSGTSKPLMIIGARQVGKTYIIERFCKAEFNEVLSFNLMDNPEIVEIFALNINMGDKISKIELLIGHKINYEETVIFFDEVQISEELIASMKYFAESETAYNIICAGSLLGVKLSRLKQSFPVGKVKLLNMFPMDFEEFLWAMDEELLSEEIRKCFSGTVEMPGPVHLKALDLYRKYLCVGGMPEAVKDLAVKSCDVLLFDRAILADIQTGYLADMTKYIETPLEASRIEAVYRSIPSQLGNRNGKFQYGKIQQGARARSYETALSWLVSSRMIYQCNRTSSPKAPLGGYVEENYFKLFLNDSGLLANIAEVRFDAIMLDRDFAYKGVLTENYIAGQFVAQGIPLYYWHSGNKSEIDFLIDSQQGVLPIEAKSGTNVRARSLEVYIEKFKPDMSIRVSAKNFGYANRVLSVPLYAVHMLKNI
jgi:predicted AAA+ superfamily ATPase